MTARQAVEKAIALSGDQNKARVVELECLLQAKDAYILHLEVKQASAIFLPIALLSEVFDECNAFTG